jgi:hypothetical protein
MCFPDGVTLNDIIQRHASQRYRDVAHWNRNPA